MEERKLRIERRQKQLEIETTEAEIHHIKAKRTPDSRDALDLIILEQMLKSCRQELKEICEDLKNSSSQSSSTTISTEASGSSHTSFGWSEVSVSDHKTTGRTGRRVCFQTPAELPPE